MKLGAHLRKLREQLRTSREAAASRIRCSTEHLRRIEADSSRPSPAVLQGLLDLYEASEKDVQAAWLTLARSYIPEELHTRVAIHHPDHVNRIVEATMEWAELYYELEGDDLKYLKTHIESKLE